MKDIRAASVQFQHTAGDKYANLQKVESFVIQAAAKGVELICFPEMCITGYWHVRKLSRSGVEDLAESVPDGPSSEALLQLAASHNMTIGAGLIEKTPDGTLYNAYLVAMADGRTAVHRKLHTFISEYMRSGDAYTVFDTPTGCRVAVLTCYDNNLVENVRMSALMGAEVLMAPHQTGGCASRSPRAMGRIDPEIWNNRSTDPEAIEKEFAGPKGRGWLMRWLPARAHDNGLFVLFSNGVGLDDDEVRTGNAMILDPYGEILVESTMAGDDMVIADLDSSVQAFSTGRRWLRTRRPELYTPLCTPSGSEEDTRKVRFESEFD